MSWLDLGAVAVIGLSALSGFRRGLVLGVLSLAGVVGGAFLGSRIAPSVLGAADSQYVPLVALGGAVVVSFLAQALFAFVGRRVRTLLIAIPPLKMLDHVGGFFLGGATGLALCWAVGAVMLYLPGETGLRQTAQRSAVLSALNEYLPPSDVMSALARSDPFSILAGPGAGVAPPDPAIVRASGVVGAYRSVVRIRGNACGFGLEGSGWVAGRGIVVTNAHVVAGIEKPIVDHGDGTPRVEGIVVEFDAKDDIAIIRAPGVTGAPLPLASGVEAGTSGAILGFPKNGPYRAKPARVGREVTFLSRDAYGNFPVPRTTTPIRGDVQPGNSGGPVVGADGRVLATVFGTRSGGGDSGYGVPNDRVARYLSTPGTVALATSCAEG